MGRKKRHKAKTSVPSTEKPQVGESMQKKEGGFSLKKIILPVVVTLGIAMAAIWYFTKDSDKQNEIVSADRKPFPTIPARLPDNIVFDDFAGPEACASCHSDIYGKWKKSTHGQAGGSPKDVKVIGKFDGVPRRFKDATLTPYRAANGDYMFNLKTDGLGEQVYKVDGVVGGGHMLGGGTQTYFSYFPDGTLRMLPFDFIRDEQVWFGETSKGEGWVPITPDRIIDKESEWLPSRVLGTHLNKLNCQECHGSQIKLDYALDKKIFTTKFNTLAINCESCHGPGKDHIKIVSGQDWKDQPSLGLKSLATLGKEGSLNVCFNCHALKNSFEPGFLPGKDREEYYSTLFSMFGTQTENPYHADGRIKEFAYQINHLSSDCYINGSMTCVGCHD
ncbi:MAG: multiheme c-type cytochrome, partial [Cyclobacteriaceae bacterium]